MVESSLFVNHSNKTQRQPRFRPVEMELYVIALYWVPGESLTSMSDIMSLVFSNDRPTSVSKSASKPATKSDKLFQDERLERRVGTLEFTHLTRPCLPPLIGLASALPGPTSPCPFDPRTPQLFRHELRGEGQLRGLSLAKTDSTVGLDRRTRLGTLAGTLNSTGSDGGLVPAATTQKLASPVARRGGAA